MESQGLEPEEIYCGVTSSQRGSDLPGVSSALCGLALSGERDGVCSSLCSQVGKWRCAPGSWAQSPLLGDCSASCGSWVRLQIPSACGDGAVSSYVLVLEFQILGFGALLLSPNTAMLLCVGTLGQGGTVAGADPKGLGAQKGKYPPLRSQNQAPLARVRWL